MIWLRYLPPIKRPKKSRKARWAKSQKVVAETTWIWQRLWASWVLPATDGPRKPKERILKTNWIKLNSRN